MDEIRELMQEKRWTVRSLAKRLGCTRYLLDHVVAHDPETNAQRELARKVIAFLKGQPLDQLWTARKSSIPLLGRIPAGPLAQTEGAVRAEEYVSLPDLDPREHFAVRVWGNSMEPSFYEHDIVVCRRVEGAGMPVKDEGPTPLSHFSPYAGKIVCALVDGAETTLKRLEIQRTGQDETSYELILRPINPHSPVIYIKPQNSFAIQGVAVRLIREI